MNFPHHYLFRVLTAFALGVLWALAAVANSVPWGIVACVGITLLVFEEFPYG